MALVSFLPDGPRVEVVGDGDGAGARLVVQVAAAELRLLPRAFHCADVFPPDGSVPGLRANAPARLELRLDDELAARLAGDVSLADEVARRAQAERTDELLRSIHWYLTKVEQGAGGGPALSLHTVYDQAQRVGRDLGVRDLELMPQPLEAQPDDGLHTEVLEFLADTDHDDLDAQTVRVPVVGASGPFDLFVHTPGQRRLLVYATWPEIVPEDRRHAVMELVTRLNVGEDLAWLELDLDRGVVSARAGVGLPADVEVAAMLDEVLGAALYALDAARPTIEDVALHGRAPVDAIEGVAARLNLDDATADEIAEFFAGFEDDD